MPVSEAVPARDKAERLIATFAFYGGFLLTGYAPSTALCSVCSNVHREVHATCWIRGRLGRRVGQSNICHLENKLLPEGLLGQGLLVSSHCILFVQDEIIDYGNIDEMIKKTVGTIASSCAGSYNNRSKFQTNRHHPCAWNTKYITEKLLLTREDRDYTDYWCIIRCMFVKRRKYESILVVVVFYCRWNRYVLDAPLSIRPLHPPLDRFPCMCLVQC